MASIGLTLLLVCIIIPYTIASVGLVEADSTASGTPPSTAGQTFCIFYNPQFKELPSSFSGQPSQPVANFTNQLGCNDTYPDQIKGKVVAVARGNCSFVEKATIIQARGGVAALVVDLNDDDDMTSPGVGNVSDYDLVNITVAVMRHKDFLSLMTGGSEVKVWMYSPAESMSKFDPAVLVMFGMATVCVVIGGLWSGKSQMSSKKSRSRARDDGKASEDEDQEKREMENLSLGMGIAMSVGLIVFFCVTLTLLYFFYDYLVYVIIAIFSIAGVNALFQVFSPLWKRLIPCIQSVPLPGFSKPPQVRSIVLVLLALGVVVTWFVLRHESYAWVLQDVIGFCFCLYVMKGLVMPSLKACTILLGLLFFYDIFFVFITPYFTKNGESVMIKVATGGGSKSGEQMPTVFVLPHMWSSAISKCVIDKGSMLGFGDVIVPGLLISYNCAFDLKTQNSASGRKSYVYFIASCVAYLVGLLFTGVALFLMESGQPALLYLVPCTVLTTIAIATIRKELGYMWRGHECPKKNDDVQRSTRNSPASSPGLAQHGDTSGNADDEDDDPNENQSLIQ